MIKRAHSQINRQLSQNFWDKMRKQNYDESLMTMTKNKISHAYDIPKDSLQAFTTSLYNNSIFRKIATVHQGTEGDLTIYTFDSDTVGLWGRGDLPELFDEIDSPIKKPIEVYRLSVMTHVAEETAQNNEYNFRTVISESVGKGLAKAEDNAFINGSGVDEPTGILHETQGAEIGVTTSTLTYDAITQLFFSLDKDFRKNAVWIMNDETAIQLRLLKSDNGIPLWNHNTDTIFSHEVVIVNDMPSTGSVIALGDFKYYAIVQRVPLTMNVLHEKFALFGHIGYIAYEYLDAKLIRQDAVKLLKLETE